MEEEEEVSLKRISSMEDEYSRLKKCLLSEMEKEEQEKEEGPLGPEITSVEDKMKKRKEHPRPERRRSSDKLESIFGPKSSTSLEEGPEATARKAADFGDHDLVAFSRRIGDDEPFPGALLSPELEATPGRRRAGTATAATKKEKERERRPSQAGEVYTIREEEEEGSPTTGDLVSGLQRVGRGRRRGTDEGGEEGLTGGESGRGGKEGEKG